MQINSISANTYNNTPSFGRINLCSGARDVLKKGLKGNEIDELQQIAKAEQKNPIDVNLFGRYKSEKKLEAKIVGDDTIKERGQHFFESQMNFIKRCVKEAHNEWDKLLERQKHTNIDDIEF
jgi:hypothetical protein